MHYDVRVNPRPASILPPHIPREISREDMVALPIRRYEGEVVLVEAHRQLVRAMDDIGHERVVGWDTETRPAFRKGESHLPALLQVATGSAVYLFQLTRLDVSREVAAFFGAAGTIKAGVSVADDLRQLKKVFALEEQTVLDLGKLAHRHGLEQTGLRNLAGIFLGFRIPKGNRTSNWAAARLSPQQITYAATDAWACRELYLKFQDLGLL